MRLIDAGALMADIERTIENSGCVNHEGEIMDCVRYASEVDAVPVVRCGECIKPLTECPFKEYMMLKTDYCSYGEKMESEGEDGTNTILERRGMG